MLLSDYPFEINTRNLKRKKLSNTNYWLNRGGPAFAQNARMHFMRTTPKIFALADGRTERVFHKQNKF